MVRNVVGMLMADELEMARVDFGLLESRKSSAVSDETGQQVVKVPMMSDPHNGIAPCIGFSPKAPGVSREA